MFLFKSLSQIGLFLKKLFFMSCEKWKEKPLIQVDMYYISFKYTVPMYSILNMCYVIPFIMLHMHSACINFLIRPAESSHENVCWSSLSFPVVKMSAVWIKYVISNYLLTIYLQPSLEKCKDSIDDQISISKMAVFTKSHNNLVLVYKYLTYVGIVHYYILTLLTIPI